LNTSIDQVVLSYQTFTIEEGQCTGFIACAKKSVIDQYLRVCDDYHFLPYRLIPYSLASIDSYCQNKNIIKERCCVIHCSEQAMIHLCILQDRKCEVFREIAYENLQKTFRDIEQTISHALAISKCKYFDHIHFFGQGKDSDLLAEKLKARYGEKFVCGKIDNNLSSLAVNRRFFQVTYFKIIAFPFSYVRCWNSRMIIILLLMTFIVTILAAQILQLDTLIIGAQSTYTTEDIRRAQQLIERMEEL
jgi:hypothetical protein